MSASPRFLNSLNDPKANFFGLPSADALSQIALIVPEGNPGGRKAMTALRLVSGSAPEWLEAPHEFSLWLPESAKGAVLPKGNVLASFACGGSPAAVVSDGAVALAFDPAEALSDLLNERYATLKKPITASLPFHYYRIPAPIRLWGHQWAGARGFRSGPGFPSWPIEPAAEALRALMAAAVAKASGAAPAPMMRWPGGKRFAVVLSHDMDTRASFPAAGDAAREEEARGLRSCWNVVGNLYRHDHETLRALQFAGHEIALHGYNHDNRLPYLDAEAIERRLDRCEPFMNRYGVLGFRSPSLLHSERLDRALEKRFAWSSSVIDSDIRSVAAPRRGVASAFPFYKGNLLEIPITAPLDDKLWILGYRGGDFVNVIEKKIRWAARVGGLFQMATHPEPHLSGSEPLRGLYRRALDLLAGRDDAWIALPGEVAAFWRERTGTVWRPAPPV